MPSTAAVMAGNLLAGRAAERLGAAKVILGVALFGSLGASGVVGGLHTSIFISVALSLAVVCLAPFLRAS